MVNRSSREHCGKIYLVGAGPGDPGLLTLKGAAVLCNADVVVYDDLASQELLLQAKPGAELIDVGGHAKQRLSQEEINRLLVERAARGKQVCRLKEGDPFAFGRAGEEAEYIAAAGVPFEIVPGVSAGCAAPAYAGIPLIHHKLSSSVSFITGEDVEKASSPPEWKKIAQGASTLVFLSVKTFPEVAQHLIAAGRVRTTPVAVIRRGTRGDQQVVCGTLETIDERTRDAGLQPPALAVVGDVVGLRGQIRWFECLPLFGQRILITRSREQAAELAVPLRALGAETIELPVIAIRDPEDWSPLDRAARSVGGYDWIIFTSVNGVKKFLERMAAADGDIRELAGTRLCAIGPATAAELRRHLLRVEKVPREYHAEGVLEALSGETLAGKRILIPRAKVARDVLPDELRKRGAAVDVVEAYRTMAPAESAERAGAIFSRHKPTIITFTSSSTVRNLIRLLPGKAATLLQNVKLASIGPITSKTLRQEGLAVDIEAREFTIPSLIEAMVEAMAHTSSPDSRQKST